MVPVDRVAHAGGVDCAVGRQQAALRHADGDQARQNQRAADSEHSGARSGWCADSRTRTNRRAKEAEVHADPAWFAQRSGNGAGGKVEDGGARVMSVLLVLEQSGGKTRRASWEALAAAL